jgi:hypothetical protein
VFTRDIVQKDFPFHETSMATSLSFNFTKNWQLKTISPGLTWNPYTDGKIQGGLQVVIPAAAVGLHTTSPNTNTNGIAEDLKVFVESLQDASGNTLKCGMALWKYSSLGDGNGYNTPSTLATEGTIDQKLSGYQGSTSCNEFLVVRNLVPIPAVNPTHWEVWLGGYSQVMRLTEYQMHTGWQRPVEGSNLVFVQVGMNGYSDNSEFNINTIPRFSPVPQPIGPVGAVGYTLQIVTEIEPEEFISENPAIWETEPKDAKDLEIYYEATGAIPINFDESNIHEAFPVGSSITYLADTSTVIGYDGLDVIVDDTYSLVTSLSTATPTYYHVVRPDGLELGVGINAIANPNITIDPFLYNGHHYLPWYNCYSFGNGVESDRIRDNYNLPFIARYKSDIW